MGVSLILGPPHAGKVALLLDRVVASLERDPWLIVPTQPDVELAERELVARTGALLDGRVGTFDRLFEHLAFGDGAGRRIVGAAERALLVRRVAQGETARAFASSQFAGYQGALAETLDELDAALVSVGSLPSHLRRLVEEYHGILAERGEWDTGQMRRRAVERARSDLNAWHGQPVFAYGFEDLTGAQWAVLEALGARADVHVSLPYEPGRAAYVALARTVESISRRAQGAITELPPGSARHLPASLAHLERTLFTDDPSVLPLDGSVRFLEGAGARGTLELVADAVIELIRNGTKPEEIAVVAPSVERVRAPLETAFGAVGIPLAVESRQRLRATPFGVSLLALLRFVWLRTERPDLFLHLRSPYSGLARREVDWVEGRLRGRAVTQYERVVTEVGELRAGKSLPLADTAEAEAPAAAVRSIAESMLRNAWGTSVPPLDSDAQRDLRAFEAVRALTEELARGIAAGSPAPDRAELLGLLEQTTVRGDTPGLPGRVAVLDLRRVRTRRFEVVVLLGLEQGSFPRRERPSAFLGDEDRRVAETRGALHLVRADSVSRDRYLFITACTRPSRRLFLVREAVGEEGLPREASSFWDAVRDLFDPDDVRRATTRRPLSELTRRLEDASTERERFRALARLAARDVDDAQAIALANGWERRLERALGAFRRSPAVTSQAARTVMGARDAFAVSDLERMAGCSAAWFVERYLRPGAIDKEVDAMMRGSILHAALQRFYAQLPSAIPGAERVTPENLDQAITLMRTCANDAIASGLRIDAGELVRRELEEGLRRDLELFVRDEAESKSAFVPRRFEHLFRDYELTPGVVVSGKIDRVDVDPHSARGIVIDYKSGAAAGAAEIEKGEKLQLPLYLRVLRDQIGLEPMGGLYLRVGGTRDRRGILRDDPETAAGFKRADYVADADFEAALASAGTTAIGLVERIRAGDVRLDPTNDECPAWCDLWRICRRPRP